uniref:Chorein_N domain-containing protein n=3 Tax=Mesocestoides corti TaxID=53468 RepID=A0A5K3FLW9_MESCO
MLIRLVSAVLNRFLGQYVENLDTERLSYSLGYQGNVILTDLRLKEDALSHLLGLPLRLKASHIARVKLHIPLTQLRSQPWCITIEDAELVVYPNGEDDHNATASTTSDLGPTDEADPDEILRVRRRAYLDRLESRWWQVVQQGGLVGAAGIASPTDSSWWSYGVSLVYGIVSNLHVEIRNIHFYFVDEKGVITGNRKPSFSWGILLDRMTVQATDENWNPSNRSSEQQIEFKSIDIVGLSVYWLEKSDRQRHHLIPPSQFSIHLLRRTTPEPLTSDETARIEVDAKLESLNLDLSKRALGFSYKLIKYFKNHLTPTRRPRLRPSKQPSAWWRYAACELVPGLRKHLSPRQTLDLDHLADEASLTNRYVRAYEAHLLQGLGITATTGVEALESLEERMSLERVALLRQVAMQRAACQLKQHQPIVRRERNQPPANPPSQSWWPSFLSAGAATTTSASPPPESADDEGDAPRPWRLWWWFSAAPPVEKCAEEKVDTTNSEAALMLLNELVAAQDVGQVLTRDRLFCKVTCCVDRFRMALDDQAPLCSLTADDLRLQMETRPRQESLLFNASLHSLVVSDERTRLGGRVQPLFPAVISPQPTSGERPSDSTADLFWLEYATGQPASETPASLRIRTAPLRVICQPELFNEAVKFFEAASSGFSNQASALGRVQESAYDTIKSQTKANLRAALHNVEAADELQQGLDFGRPESPSARRGAPPSTAPSLSLHLDIAAPRILLPERLWPTPQEEVAEAACGPPPSLLGVICDFGRFRLSNWDAESISTGEAEEKAKAPARSVDSVGEEDDDTEEDESDAFETPCGTPVASDSESVPSPTVAHKRRLSLHRRRPPFQRQRRRLYETYLLELDQLRILAGRLDVLQASAFWPDLLSKGSIPSGANRLHASVVASQAHLVDRFSLAIWITRRVVRMADIPSKTSLSNFTIPPGVPSDLPGLLVCLEQRQCVLRLSDVKVAAIRRCLAAVASASTEKSEACDSRPRPQAPPGRLRHSSTLQRRHRQRCVSAGGTSSPRRTILLTFRMSELILQLDSRGRPLAECRLGSTAARFARSKDADHSLTRYDMCMQVHSLTVADALCGLGGDFDLLAASHRGVRLDTLSGNLNVTSTPRSEQSSPRVHLPSQSQPASTPQPFLDSIDDDTGSSTALIRVDYSRSCITSETAVSQQNSRRMDVKFRHLDLLGNLNTLLELISFVRYVTPESETTTTLSSASSANPSSESPDTNSTVIDNSSSLEMSISVERLSLVLIHVTELPKPHHQMDWDEDERTKTSPPQATAERLATITLLGALFKSHASRGLTQRFEVSLAGLQVLDLMGVGDASLSGPQHRHIFAAGQCLDPELPDDFASVGQKPVFTVSANREACLLGYHIRAEVSSPVYVHKPRTLHEISSWFSRLYHWTAVVGVLAQKLKNVATRQVVEAPAASPFASFRATFEQPVVVFPAAATSARVLIARLGRLTLTSSGPHLVELSVARASLASLDVVEGIPLVRGTSQTVKAMLTLAHYLGLVTSAAEVAVLEDISADLHLSRQTTPRSWSQSTNPGVFDWPAGFDAEAPLIPFADTDPVLIAGPSKETWVMVEACLVQPLHVCLTKIVYQQLLQTLDNLTYDDDDDDADGGYSDGHCAASSAAELTESHRAAEGFYDDDSSWRPQATPLFAVRFRMPYLVVETFADMSGEAQPVGLTRLTLADFFITASKSPRLVGGLTRIEASLASLLLENMLPGDAALDGTNENRYLLFSHQSPSSSMERRGRLRRQRRLADSCPDVRGTPFKAFFQHKTTGVAERFRGPRWRNTQSFTDPRSVGEEVVAKRGAGLRLSSKRRRSASMDAGGQVCAPTRVGAAGAVGGRQFVRIRVLLVDQGSPLFSTKYQSKRRFVDVDFSSLTCYLSLHPWVLLLDFLSVGSPITACDEFDIEPVTKSRAKLDEVDKAMQTGGDYETTVTTLNVSEFSLLLDTAVDRSQPPEHLLRASAASLHLHLTNYSRPIAAGGDWMYLDGRLGEVLVEDLSHTGKLYGQRFVTTPSRVGGSDSNENVGFLSFRLTKYQLPDPELSRRTEDGVLRLRLGPAYYVHTQDFLVTSIDTLDRFLQYQDLMNRVRASSAGYKVRQRAPLSMRLRLDVEAQAPIVVLPVSAASDAALVCDLGTLTAVNDFVWHDDPNIADDEDDVKVAGGDFEVEKQRCKYCAENYEEGRELGQDDLMTQSHCPTMTSSTESLGTDAESDESPCLLDRIQLTLNHIEVYLGKRHDADAEVVGRGVHFRWFSILPASQSLLTEPFGLSVRVERNLSSGRRQHAAPDWRLSARLRLLSPLHLSLDDYALLRGVLSHNLASSPPAQPSTNQLPPPHNASPTREPSYTRKPHKVFAFSFDLEDVAICMAVPSDWPSLHQTTGDSQSRAFCRLDLTRSRLTYDSFSCGRRVTDLSCSAATFTDTRFTGCAQPQNLFPSILSALTTQESPNLSPQFRVTQVVAPSNGNATHPSNSSCMTFHLRSMRLMLALDWLVDLHRFLTHPPLGPSSLGSSTNSLRRSSTNATTDSCLMEENAPQQPQGTSDLRIFTEQTEFVIMENPAELDTNTVVLTGAMCFLLRSGGLLSQSLMVLCLHGVGVHTFAGCVDSRAVIIEPTDLEVLVTPPPPSPRVHHQHSSRSSSCTGLQELVSPRASLVVRTSTLRTHFSYTDSQLFVALLDSLREQAAFAFGSSAGRDADCVASATLEAPPPPPPPPESRAVLWLRHLVEHLTPHISSVDFQSAFSLCLIDDCLDADVPLAEIVVSDISLKWKLT